MDMIVLALILVAVVTAFITRWLPIEVTSVLAICSLMLTGILDFDQALAGFSNPATITIGAMFILSAGLTRTGVLDIVTAQLMQHSKGSTLRFLLLLAIVVPLLSAFMNNTPVVIMMVPVVLAVSRQLDVKPSKLMIPLSYFAILGGTCTVIGTNTNILVDQIYREAGYEGFSMFEFTQMGVVYVMVGVVFILFVGQRLLPERSPLSSLLPRKRTAHFVTEVLVEKDTRLEGVVVGNIFQQDLNIHLLELVRDKMIYHAPETEEMVLQAGDALIIQGVSTGIMSFIADYGASLAPVVADSNRVPMRSFELTLAEAVILTNSPFVGRTVEELALNKCHNVMVLAVQRRGRHHRYYIRKMVLKPGDVLLLQAGEQGFSALEECGAVLLIEGLERDIPAKHRAALAVAIMGSVIVGATLTPLSLVTCTMLGAALMLSTRCLRMDEAFRAFDTQVLFILVGTIPLGIAMEETGLAQVAVDILLQVTGNCCPVVKVSLFYLLTSILTEVLSNKATAVLLTPIALEISSQMGVDAKPFLMAICFGASASFMTPVGYATNTLVMGPGGYRFSDYLKVGIPMNLLMWLIASLLIPVFWAF